MATPSIGSMRQRVEIQEFAAGTPNSYGEAKPTWRTVTTVWANVQPIGGSEPFQAGRVSAETTHTVDLRYVSWLTAKHRLRLDGVVLNVESAVNPDGRKRFHRLTCIQTTAVEV